MDSVNITDFVYITADLTNAKPIFRTVCGRCFDCSERPLLKVSRNYLRDCFKSGCFTIKIEDDKISEILVFAWYRPGTIYRIPHHLLNDVYTCERSYFPIVPNMLKVGFLAAIPADIRNEICKYIYAFQLGAAFPTNMAYRPPKCIINATKDNYLAQCDDPKCKVVFRNGKEQNGYIFEQSFAYFLDGDLCTFSRYKQSGPVYRVYEFSDDHIQFKGIKGLNIAKKWEDIADCEFIGNCVNYLVYFSHKEKQFYAAHHSDYTGIFKLDVPFDNKLIVSNGEFDVSIPELKSKCILFDNIVGTFRQYVLTTNKLLEISKGYNVLIDAEIRYETAHPILAGIFCENQYILVIQADVYCEIHVLNYSHRLIEKYVSDTYP